MIWQGQNYTAALDLLALNTPKFADPELDIESQALQASALTQLDDIAGAKQVLSKAAALCREHAYPACNQWLVAQGGLSIKLERLNEAQLYLKQAARQSSIDGDFWTQARALVSLGVVSLRQEHLDEALSWLREGRIVSQEVGSVALMELSSGNEGWAYYRLGNIDKALELFRDAKEKAAFLKNAEHSIWWLTTEGNAYSSAGKLDEAESAYQQVLTVAREIKSKEDIVNASMDLAEVYIESHRTAEAKRYADQSLQIATQSGDRVDMLYSEFIEGQIAAMQRDWKFAVHAYSDVDRAPESQTSMRLASELAMAGLYETRGQAEEAQKEYVTALGTFEGARAELKNEESQLPFVANAARIYDNYIHFLVGEGKVDEALMVADQSRARTLLQGLGVTAGQAGNGLDVKIAPEAVARKAGATLLFYWLGEKQSYLWVVTPGAGTRGGAQLFPLAPKAEIEQRIERYRRALLGPEDPLAAGNADGRALYAALIGPAAGLIHAELSKKLPVMVLADGALCQLNFATLIAPASEKMHAEHYWIEDATVISAPSLAMLAAGRAAPPAKGGRLLLMGDAVSPDPNYPRLEYAATEMEEIEKHFAAGERVVFARERAVPEAYLKSDPGKFAFIHFVSHGVASQTDPLDSAIILSKGGLSKSGLSQGGVANERDGVRRGEEPELSRNGLAPGEGGGAGEDDSFKLYAREIMQHPIDARLVTISACYGNGTRVYVGEGLVGLSWAFLHAGAHNAIGALWEASDRSTAVLMDRLYSGLAAGEASGTALRNAQLELLHSKTNFRKPFYWAPFQIYTRM